MSDLKQNYWNLPIAVELSRFRVKAGKSARVDAWMACLREHLPEVLLTLEDEKMYVETIFREVRDGDEYLYWYSIQGQTSHSVRDSSHEIDKVHLQFWEECIDRSTPRYDAVTEVVMVPTRLQAQMK